MGNERGRTLKVPNRILQSRNGYPNFAQSRNPDVFFFGILLTAILSIRPYLTPILLKKIQNPEIQMREIPDPEKPIGDPQGKPLLNPDPPPFFPSSRSPTVPDLLPLSTPITHSKGGMLKRTKINHCW